MSKNAYEWEPLTEKDLDELEAYAKNAVRRLRKPVRSAITNMLNAGCAVPGIRLVKKKQL